MRHCSKSFLSLLLLICWLGNSTLTANAQDSLRNSWENDKIDEQSLRRVLSAMNKVDSSFGSYFPIWIVLDQTLKLRIYDAFRNDREIFVDQSKGETVYVVTNPDSNEIVDIWVGDSIHYGRLYARTKMDSHLKELLLRRLQYPTSDEEPSGYKNNGRNHRKTVFLQQVPDWVSSKLGLLGGDIRFGNHWFLEGKVGDDILGYPFWSSGQSWLLVGYKSIKLGARLPVHGGLPDFSLGLRQRFLNGSSGVAGEFEFEWDAVKPDWKGFDYAAIGGVFTVGGLGRRRTELIVQDPQELGRYRSIPIIVQAYYATHFTFDSKRQNLRFRFGVGMHRVTNNRLIGGGYDIEEASAPIDFLDPVLSCDYRNQRIDWFRLSVLYSKMLMLSAWAEILPKFLYVEVKYATVLLRDPRSWEQRNYIYPSFGFMFDF